MKLYHPITVDLYNPHPLPRMNAQQHNVGRGALITLTANGQIIVPDEETVRIFAKRPDKKTSYLDCSILEGKIQADFTDQMLAAEGNVEVELELTTTETNITTPIFIVEVNKSNVKEGVQSSNEYKALEKYTAEAKEAAEQAQEIYDNIPNYEARLAELEAYKANSILSKASGEVVTTTDSAKVKPKNIKLFGKGKQRQYEGKNFVDVSAFQTTTVQGVEWINNGDGSITARGTATGESQVVIWNGILDTGEYIISGCPSGGSHSTYVLQITDYPIVNSYGYELGTEMPKSLESGTYAIRLRVYAGNTVNHTFHPMIRPASFVDGTFEPYVGNEPSPNMNYPQKAEFLGESGSIGGEVLTSNFFDISKFVEQHDVKVQDNGFVFTNTIGEGLPTAIISSTTLGMLCPSLKDGDTVYLQFDGVNVKYNEFYLLGTGRDWISGQAITITQADLNRSFYLYGNYNQTCVLKNIIVSKAPLPYESYTEQPFTSQTPNGLRGIPLGQTIPDAIKNSPIHMSGVYWDGEQYQIADTKNENGKYVQRVLEVIFDGSDDEGWSEEKNTTIGNRYSAQIGENVFASDKTIGVTSVNTSSQIEVTGATYNQRNKYTISSNGNIYVSLNGTETLEEFKTLLAENPMSVYCVLANPIITDTTEEEKAQLDKLVMNYPNTTIVNDEGAYMEVEYVCDTEIYIEENYVPRDEFEELKDQIADIQAQLVNA